jgi:alpha-N-arabinofuranosidase
VPFEGNPILTQRDLPPERIHPITTAGHADLVQTPAGDWWAVFLATRAYDRRFYNNGRETFLLPVDWRGDWPMILPQGELIPYVGQRPVLGAEQAPGQTLTGNFTWRDDFDAETIDQHWLTLRSFDRSWITLEDGQLRLDALRVGLHSLEQPSFLTRRQQHLRYRASVQLRVPTDPDVAAGIAAFQNESHHYFLGVQRGNSGYEIFLEQAAAGAPQRIRTASIDLAAGAPLILAIDGDAGRIGFGYRRPDHPREPAGPATESWLARELDGKLLSTAVAGGFVGTTLGVYARRTPH